MIAEEIETRIFGGVPIVKSEVVKALVSAGNIGRSTAYDLFNDVFETVQRSARYQVGPSSDIQPTSGNTIEATRVVLPEPASIVQAASGTPDPVNSTNLPLPAWVVDGHTLTLFEDACSIRDHWRVAVAAWRSAKARRRTDAGVELADDPVFRRIVLDRSSWSGHRRH